MSPLSRSSPPQYSSGNPKITLKWGWLDAMQIIPDTNDWLDFYWRMSYDYGGMTYDGDYVFEYDGYTYQGKYMAFVCNAYNDLRRDNSPMYIYMKPEDTSTFYIYCRGDRGSSIYWTQKFSKLDDYSITIDNGYTIPSSFIEGNLDNLPEYNPWEAFKSVGTLGFEVSTWLDLNDLDPKWIYMGVTALDRNEAEESILHFAWFISNENEVYDIDIEKINHYTSEQDITEDLFVIKQPVEDSPEYLIPVNSPADIIKYLSEIGVETISITVQNSGSNNE